LAARDSYIVDGYNVLHALFPSIKQTELEDKRRWLAEQLAGFAALRGAPVTLVFDAHSQARSSCQQLAGTMVEVCFAGGSRSSRPTSPSWSSRPTTKCSVRPPRQACAA